jgi:cell division protein FtsB
MADRRNKGLNRREQRALRLFVLVVVVFSLLFLLFMPGRGLLPYQRLKKEVRELVRENKALQQRNVELAGEIERLKHDDAYLEDLARKKYGMLKRNEEVYELKTSPSGTK